MKKIVLELKKLVFISATALILCACSSSNGSSEEPKEPENNKDESSLTIAEQKEQMNNIATSVMDKLSPTEFQNIETIISYVAKNYADDDYYNCDEVEDWYNDCLNAITSTFSSTVIYSKNFTTYKRVWAASNFTGHFSAENGKWNYTKADDLQFSFKDGSKNDCLLTLTTSGNTYTVHNESFDDETYIWSSYYSYTRYKSHINYFVVPEKVTLTLAQGNKNLISITINTNISGVLEGIDPSNAIVNMSTDVVVNNLEIKVYQAYYNGSTGANEKVEAFYDGTRFLYSDASISGNIIMDEYNDASIGKAEVFTFNNELEGKVQIKGTIKDCDAFCDYIDFANNKYYNNKTDFDKYLEKANAFLEANVYYNSSKNASASVLMKSFVDDSYYYRTYYEAKPVIMFADGTSYAYDAFFNETNFNTTIKAYNKWYRDLKELLSDLDIDID